MKNKKWRNYLVAMKVLDKLGGQSKYYLDCKCLGVDNETKQEGKRKWERKKYGKKQVDE